MSGRRSRRPPSLNLSLSSRETSPANRTTPSPEPDTDDERMSSSCSSRPLSSGYSSGPYCVKRPSLSEVLNGNAPAPYTLSAFTAYLSQNHCLETLEFTMDAGRYKDHWKAITGDDTPPTPESKGCEYVRMLWQRLMATYIVPNGPKEVNLPCTVRNHILSIPTNQIPPPPESLDSAVHIVYELMQESVLMPFISDCQQQANCGSSCGWGVQGSDENLYMRGSLDERMLQRKRNSNSPPPMLGFVSNSYPTGSGSSRHNSQRAASPFSVSLGWHRHSSHMGPGSWSTSGDSFEESYTSSPTLSSCPMTPPTTPPTSEAMLHGSITSSPKHSKTVDKAEKSWKKMTGNFGKQFGFGKKKTPQIWGEHGTY
ncbi:uncharacterized protein H6S33_008760 [Morchella sextelata]|uniref:uncharacterized protein n=1 Tax=Morchella sextelata TaxID=1174677 RepID=UPI001D057213|nr:uncharacterized protein H6S33_008760 [Morchella sextelata]KAH0602421.1 hypothetical protein H6S33_008760 [Morchella sextelata]